jgi:hypothetical protein
MTRFCCPSCRLRFAGAATALLETCPRCAGELTPVISAAETIGYRLFDAADAPPVLPMAVEAAIPLPGLRPDRD